MNLTWDSNEIDTDAVAAAASRETTDVKTVVKPGAAKETAARASVSISFESHVKFISISF